MLAAVVLAAPFDLKAPGEDERKYVTGFVGDSLVVFGGRGLGVVGTRTPQLLTPAPFSQGGGEFNADVSAVLGPTPFNGMFGGELDFALGLMRTEDYGNGVLRDQRKSEDAADPAKMWLTVRLGARYVIAPPAITFGSNAVRLGLVAGLQLEGNGARSWTMAGAFTAGAHLVFGRPGFGARLSWLAIPDQQGAEDHQLQRHQLSLDLGISVLWLGARVQLDHVETRAMLGLPAATLDSTTVSFVVGYRPADLFKK